jgi:alkanesulfonate monooxygenase SsuD/methylene tetrahydromethanopterin reductase-like flavin-dependent oxidoreductase (luciferase family)
MGFPIFISGITPVPELKERLESYREARRGAGFGDGPVDVMLRIPTYVGATAEEALRVPEASTVETIQRQARDLVATAATEEMAERFRRNAATPYEEMVRNRLVYGTPESVTERLRLYQEELGLSGVVLEMNYGGQIPYDRLVSSINLMMEKVIPEFR